MHHTSICGVCTMVGVDGSNQVSGIVGAQGLHQQSESFHCHAQVSESPEVWMDEGKATKVGLLQQQCVQQGQRHDATETLHRLQPSINPLSSSIIIITEVFNSAVLYWGLTFLYCNLIKTPKDVSDQILVTLCRHFMQYFSIKRWHMKNQINVMDKHHPMYHRKPQIIHAWKGSPTSAAIE